MGNCYIRRNSARNAPVVFGVAKIVDQWLIEVFVARIVLVKVLCVLREVDRGSAAAAVCCGSRVVGVLNIASVVDYGADGLHVVVVYGILAAETTKYHVGSAVITDCDRKVGNIVKRVFRAVRGVLDRSCTALVVACRVLRGVVGDLLVHGQFTGGGLFVKVCVVSDLDGRSGYDRLGFVKCHRLAVVHVDVVNTEAACLLSEVIGNLCLKGGEVSGTCFRVNGLCTGAFASRCGGRVGRRIRRRNDHVSGIICEHRSARGRSRSDNVLFALGSELGNKDDVQNDADHTNKKAGDNELLSSVVAGSAACGIVNIVAGTIAGIGAMLHGWSPKYMRCDETSRKFNLLSFRKAWRAVSCKHKYSIVKLRFNLHIVTRHIHKSKEGIFDNSSISGAFRAESHKIVTLRTVLKALSFGRTENVRKGL